MSPDPAPVLRSDCQWCGNRKHNVQYTGARVNPDTKGGRILTHDVPGVCRVCPRCDSPGAAVEES